MFCIVHRLALPVLCGVGLSAAVATAAAADVPLPEAKLDGPADAMAWLDLEKASPEHMEPVWELAEQLVERIERRDGDAAAVADEVRAFREAFVQYRQELSERGVRRVIGLAGSVQTDDDNEGYLFVHHRAEADLTDAAEPLVELLKLVSGSDFDPAADEVEFVPWDEEWSYLRGEDMLEPQEGDPTDMSALKAEAAKLEGAMAGVAAVISPASRQRLNEAMLEPGAVFFKDLLEPLRDLQGAGFALYAGDSARAELTMRFDPAQQAEAFQDGLHSVAMIVGQLVGFGAAGQDDEAAREEAERFRVGLSLLMLERDAGTLYKRFDEPLLNRLVDVGLLGETSDEN